MNEIEKAILTISNIYEEYVMSETNIVNIAKYDKQLQDVHSILEDCLQEKQEREWIKFETETDKEAGREILTCPIPDDEQEILITDGKNVWLDTFCNDGCECYFDSGFDFDKITHWKPLPKPPKDLENKFLLLPTQEDKKNEE